MFKLYVDDLKARFHEEKKLIKEIIKEKQYELQTTTTFEEFNEFINQDKRAVNLDLNNLKLTYGSFLEKAEVKEKEKLKEEQRKQKKIEQNFKNLFKKFDLSESSKYEEVRDKIANEEAYQTISSDQERERLFAEYISLMQETCLHHIKKVKKDKGKKKKRSRSKSTPPNEESDEEGEDTAGKHNKREHSDRGDDEAKSSKKHKKSKKKKKQVTKAKQTF